MSSVLHPVGPEPRERYWVRRVAVLVAVVVVIAVVIALVGNAMSAGSAVQAEPAPPTVVLPTAATTPSASPSPVASGSPTPGASATPGATSPSAGSSASPTPGATAISDPSQTPEAGRSADEKKEAAEKAAQKKAEQKKADEKAAEQKAAEQKKKEKAAALASCPTGDVRTTLTGPRKAKAGKDVKFALSLINGSSSTCTVKASGDDFTLTVVSGSDRIWSSDDCAKAVPAQNRKLATQKSVDWSMTWDGTRSAAGCKSRKESPKPGYYWAIANLDGAKEVRWRIILT